MQTRMFFCSGFVFIIFSTHHKKNGENMNLHKISYIIVLEAAITFEQEMLNETEKNDGVPIRRQRN